MEAGDFKLAEQRWNAKKQDCLDSAGAIQMGYTDFNKVPDPKVPVSSVPFVADGEDTPTRQVMNQMPQGVVHTVKGSGKHSVSWTIGSGGYPCYLSFDPAFPKDPAKTTGAVGGTPWLSSPDGEWTAYIFYSADPGRVQKATLDIM
jgi:hypothetical protein